MATYAVGDLQGCLEPLKALLKQVDFNGQRDTLWLTGDLINRGPDSLGTLRYIYKHRNHIHTVLGNHDLHLLAVNAGYKKPSRSDTFDEILAAHDKDPLLSWLRQQPLLHHDNRLGYTMVHAGIPPQWSLNDAIQKAQEVETIIQGQHYDLFLKNMYGNTPSGWEQGMSDTARWRVITNYFTRMRFCNAQGTLELTTKTGLEDYPKGYLPWFSHRHRKMAQQNIIFGHWAALEGETHTSNTFALDTGYVWGKSMTMMRLEDRQYFRIIANS